MFKLMKKVSYVWNKLKTAELLMIDPILDELEMDI